MNSAAGERREVEYAVHGGVSLKGHLYAPKAPGKYPAVIAVHGGGWRLANLDNYRHLGPWLAERGYVVLAVTHRLSEPGQKAFPEAVQDVRAAVQFAKGNAAELGIDRERIALMGFSLGAYLSLANSAIDPRVKAVVEFFGGMPKEMHLFMRRLCPVLIMHGEADQTIPVEEAFQLQKLLEKKGIPYEVKIYPGVGHGFEDETIWRDAGLRSLQFLQKYLVAPEP